MREEVHHILRLLFSFDGYVNRRTWWLACGGWLLFVCFVATLDGDRDDPSDWASLVVLVSLWPLLAFSVRRLHDRGKSGVWLFMIFVPLGFFWALVELGFLDTMPLAENAYLSAQRQQRGISSPNVG
jgi:uncharacterized membrane protein YhaH (DUF805 family)